MVKWIRNCFGCHLGHDEKLVNRGKHTPGSKVNLIAWVEGRIRHNIWFSKENRESPQNRKRMMLVLGKAIELEHLLRAVAKSTRRGEFARTMAKRAKITAIWLRDLSRNLPIAELKSILKAASTAKLRLNNQKQLIAIADEIAKLTEQLAKNHDGSTFSAVDIELLPLTLPPEIADIKGK